MMINRYIPEYQSNKHEIDLFLAKTKGLIMKNQKITGMQSKDARAALAKSQGEVAKETNISRAYLSQFENGIRKLTDSEITVLRDYYEDLGFVFHSEKGDYKESAKAALEGIQETLVDADTVSIKAVELSELLLQVGDLIDEIETLNTESDIDVGNDMHQFEGVEEIASALSQGDLLLNEFFLSDAAGELPSIGFLDSYGDNAHKIICCMAVQYLRGEMLKNGVSHVPLAEFPDDGSEYGKFSKAVAAELQSIIASKDILTNSVFDAVSAR